MACRQCEHPDEKGVHTCDEPQGVSRTFPPGFGQYRGPPLVMLPKEEYDLMRDCIERLEQCLDLNGARVVEGFGVVDALEALADFRKRQKATRT